MSGVFLRSETSDEMLNPETDKQTNSWWIPHLEFSKVEEPRQLERAPFVKVDPRAEEVQRESGRHRTEELKTQDQIWEGQHLFI